MKTLIILGSGTAGLISALILRQRFDKLKIKIISSKDIGIIGVGEGTTEHWSEFTSFCGINVVDLIKQSDATFKFGVMFKDWSKKDYLQYVSPQSQQLLLAQYNFMWGKIISENIDPLDIHPNNIIKSEINKGEHPHQFHFNTMKLNEYLTHVCKARNIEFEDDIIENVSIKDGKIINLKGNKNHVADFYIDCSGFKRLLINKLEAKWISFREYLPMNEAIAFPTEDTEKYNAWTLAKAMDAGWLWRIPTWKRWGNGYVYNNNYMNAEKAQKEVEKYLNKKIKIFKHIKFDAGKLDRPWISNCCAIGLSANFAEPLEASNIGTTINQAFLLMHYLSNYTKEDINQYNLKCNDIFDNVRDFVLIHYLVKKDSSKFWKELKIKIPESLKDKLKMWKNRLPLGEDFDKNYLLFNQQNFILVLHGIGFFNKEKIKNEYTLSNDMLKDLSKNIWAEKLKKDEFKGLPHKEYLNYSYYHDEI